MTRQDRRDGLNRFNTIAKEQNIGKSKNQHTRIFNDEGFLNGGKGVL